MRILVLNWRDIKHPLAGGAEISTHEHAKRWVRAGHRVIQFSSSFPFAKHREIIDGVEVIRKGNHYTVHFHAFWYYIHVLRGWADLIIDEFHFIPFFTPLYSNKKKIAFIHETAEEVWFKNQYFPINIVGFLLEPFFFKFYQNVPFITVSASTKKDLMRFGISERQIIVIHNGFSPITSSKNKEKNPMVVYLGRLAQDKGTEDAILAFYNIKQKFPKSRLWIIGREEKRGTEKSLKKLTRKLKIEKMVTFFGFVSNKKKYDLLKRAWVLIHPSIKEGWGLTIIEAASQGTPSIAYDSSGLRDSIKDGETGFLVTQGRAEKLAEKIIFLLQNAPLHKSLSKKAKLWSSNFSWEKATGESLQYIQKA